MRSIKRPLNLLKLAVKRKESEDRGQVVVHYLAEDPVAEDAVHELVPERIGAVGGQEPRLSSWSSGQDDAVCCCKVTGRGWRGEGPSDQRALKATAEQGWWSCGRNR